jgi:hypothetical protein
MKILLGPVLGFRGVTTSGWNVSALIVTDILSNPPELILQSGNRKGIKRTAKLLKAFPESNPTSQVWRFDFAVKQTARAQPVSYTIGAVENLFVVPPRNAIPNMLYASCNGFSSMKLLNDTKDANRLWRQVAEKHEARPYHLLMMGGDQLYCDSMWDKLMPLQESGEIAASTTNQAAVYRGNVLAGGSVLRGGLRGAMVASRARARSCSSAEHHDVGRSRYLRWLGIV